MDWNPIYTYLAAVKHDEDQNLKASQKLSFEGFPSGGHKFLDLLDSSLRSLFGAKCDTGVSSSCKSWSFTEREQGEADRELLENHLLLSGSLDGFARKAEEFLARIETYTEMPDGLFVMSRVNVQVDEDNGYQAVVAFYLRYLPTFQAVFGEEVELEEVADVLDPSLRNAFIYPMWDGGVARADLVKVVNKPANSPWSQMLDITPPDSTERLMQREYAGDLEERIPEEFEELRDAFSHVPPKRRHLFSETRLLPPKLGVPEVAASCRNASRKISDLYNKDSVFHLKMGSAKVTLRAEELGQTFTFGTDGKAEFLIIRCHETETQKGPLTSLELLDVERVEKALERLKLKDD